MNNYTNLNAIQTIITSEQLDNSHTYQGNISITLLGNNLHIPISETGDRTKPDLNISL